MTRILLIAALAALAGCSTTARNGDAKITNMSALDGYTVPVSTHEIGEGKYSGVNDPSRPDKGHSAKSDNPRP